MGKFMNPFTDKEYEYKKEIQHSERMCISFTLYNLLGLGKK